jgi:hypothetical protein
LFTSLLATFAIAADPGYHVIKTYKQGGDLKKAGKIDKRDRVN